MEVIHYKLLLSTDSSTNLFTTALRSRKYNFSSFNPISINCYKQPTPRITKYSVRKFGFGIYRYNYRVGRYRSSVLLINYFSQSILNKIRIIVNNFNAHVKLWIYNLQFSFYFAGNVIEWSLDFTYRCFTSIRYRKHKLIDFLRRLFCIIYFFCGVGSFRSRTVHCI
jgi:hypothetical protein